MASSTEASSPAGEIPFLSLLSGQAVHTEISPAGVLRSGGGLMPFLATLAPESYLSKHLGVGAEGAECLRVWGLESHRPGLRASLCLFCGLANYLLKLP